jgi:hypothetical protein
MTTSIRRALLRRTVSGAMVSGLVAFSLLVVPRAASAADPVNCWGVYQPGLGGYRYVTCAPYQPPEYAAEVRCSTTPSGNGQWVVGNWAGPYDTSSAQCPADQYAVGYSFLW